VERAVAVEDQVVGDHCGVDIDKPSWIPPSGRERSGRTSVGYRRSCICAYSRLCIDLKIEPEVERSLYGRGAEVAMVPDA